MVSDGAPIASIAAITGAAAPGRTARSAGRSASPPWTCAEQSVVCLDPAVPHRLFQPDRTAPRAIPQHIRGGAAHRDTERSVVLTADSVVRQRRNEDNAEWDNAECRRGRAGQACPSVTPIADPVRTATAAVFPLWRNARCVRATGVAITAGGRCC